MIISEKQILKLLILFPMAIEGNLTPSGFEESVNLLKEIEDQQSEELKEIE